MRKRRTLPCGKDLSYITLYVNNRHRLLIESLSRYYECHDANTIGKAVHTLTLIRDVEISGGKIAIVMYNEDGEPESITPISIA